MWPFWDLNRVHCDLLFTEAINQRMQVPSRLKVAGSFRPVDEEPGTEDVPPSFRMHIPDKISLAEISDASLRPVLHQQRKMPPVVEHMSPGSSAQPPPLGGFPLLHPASRPSSQKRRRLGQQSSRARRDRPAGDCVQLALHSPGQQHERPGVLPLPAGSAPLPLLAETGRIFSLQNILQTMCHLVQVLCHQARGSLQGPVPLSSQETGPGPESALEEVGVAEMAAMRKQLRRISGRLCALEEQRDAWRQKEALLYSALGSACLINAWLWLRR